MSTSSATPEPQSASIPARRSRFRLLALGGLCAFAVALALGYRHFWFERPIGSGPAGPAVDSMAFAKPWTDRPVLLLGFGDSVTAGYGASPRLSYFERLADNPPDEFPDMAGLCLRRVLPKLQTQNVALSGSTSLEHVDMLLPKLETQDAETFGIVVLTTGGNDVIHNYGRTPPREGAMYGASVEQARPWVENFATRLETILDAIATKFPGGCHFFLANIFDPTDDVGDAEHAGLTAWRDGRQVLHAYNEVIARCAERRSDVELGICTARSWGTAFTV